jgi:hypothetical protein
MIGARARGASHRHVGLGARDASMNLLCMKAIHVGAGALELLGPWRGKARTVIRGHRVGSGGL